MTNPSTKQKLSSEDRLLKYDYVGGRGVNGRVSGTVHHDRLNDGNLSGTDKPAGKTYNWDRA
jgi:hypothetical protein